MSHIEALSLPTLGTEETVLEAANLMVKNQSSDVFVIDDRGRPVGVLRHRDVVEAVAKGLRPNRTKVSEIMLRPPPAAEEHATMREISQILAKTETKHILVTRNQDIIGVIEAGELFDLVSSSLDKVEVFKAISVRTRLRMAELLSTQLMGVEDLADELGIKPITVRHHLEVLRRNGIIEEIQEGRMGKVGRPLSLFRTNQSVLKRGGLAARSVTG